MDIDTQHPVIVGDMASMTPPASADGEKPSPRADSPRGSDMDVDSGASVDDDEIRPDHYYGGGRIPIFKPTMDQFRDFQSFIHKIDKYGMESGVVKVIPPQEWLDALPSLEESVKSIRVKNPIMQEFHGSHGTYTQANIEKQRSYNLPQWKALCEETSHQPPARRGERRRAQEKPARNNARGQTNRSDSQKRKPGPPNSKSNEPEKTADGPGEKKLEGPPTPVSPQSNPVEPKSEELSEGESLPAPKPKGRQPKSVTARRKYNRGDAADYIDEEAFKDFDYHLSGSEEYTPERCEELETAYWKSLMYNNPMYGADMPGSLFDDSVTSWNVAKLPNLLDILGQKVPGVNTAYLYLGMWKATFAWHLEDVDLYSINYIHFGAPKQWYSISQQDLPKFEAAMKSIWPTDSKNCDQFLRHKTYLISPSFLKSQYGITVNKMVHYEREFVITYPYGYHSGFNLGYNCAESVNFATEKWLDYARVAKKCNCEADSVWIDIREIERKLCGEATPEYYDEMEDQFEGASDLLTPPRSVPEKSGPRKKRKHDSGESKTKRVKLHLDGPRKVPCILCPNNLDYEELLPTEDGLYHAHRRCALYIDETSILKDESGKEVVCDVDKIPKARMGLKCLFCREVKGACFQCMYGKCARAYHPTCALLAGVQVEFGKISVTADDGCEYTVPGVDLKCKYHRPKRLGSQSPESMDMDFKITETAKKLRPGDLIQFQADKEINGAVVLENRPEERALLLKVLPRGDVIELPYRWILIVKKSNFLPLPSGIKPLPAHLARKPEARKDLASTIPSHGTPFGDPWLPYQWAEFSCVKPPFNSDTSRVDVFKPEQIWYYLGRTSTECRAQYTENPARSVHNPRSNFLESVKSLRAPAMATSHPNTYSSNQQKFSSGARIAAPAPPVPTRPIMTQKLQLPATSDMPGPVFRENKGMQLLTARRLLASITEHANAGAGYIIVDPDFVAQILLGDGLTVPKNGMEKLKKAMSESMIRPKSNNGLLPLQPLNMEADEVDHLLRMLRFAIVDLAQKVYGNDTKSGKQPERASVKEPRVSSSSVAMWGNFDGSRRQSVSVYNSPYAPGFGFSQYAIKEYGLGPPRLAQKEHSAADFFAKLSQEDKEKVIQACGSVNASRKAAASTSIAPGLEMSQVSGLDIPVTTTSMDPMNLDPHHLSAFDMTLHADSPASSFSRTAIHYQSPQDFSAQVEHESSLLPRHLQDHHDLFGDQQTNQRFWQRSVPWNDGDTQSHNDEPRPFFGPHLPPAGHDYLSSDMDFERGPGSLHSMDMAGFGFDGPDDLYPDPSP
ncbi:jumonji family transcription factor [Coccidioides immitis RS]|uniref:[histone H3]-trimethyl-L-lysine(9) demethylase n=3 Tax=Coccidioides immitis TaxID=5501 RepID=J3K964_COCIM|nr:jumonji family transcription factor [Coccidioides immitis RS]EAS31415.3 jumonji family transcription factor [Coccidioides immitis RS]TPX24210.1 hypothetical protein DIZ76_013553 [Coccidioides immitis]